MAAAGMYGTEGLSSSAMRAVIRTSLAKTSSRGLWTQGLPSPSLHASKSKSKYFNHPSRAFASTYSPFIETSQAAQGRSRVSCRSLSVLHGPTHRDTLPSDELFHWDDNAIAFPEALVARWHHPSLSRSGRTSRDQQPSLERRRRPDIGHRGGFESSSRHLLDERVAGPSRPSSYAPKSFADEDDDDVIPPLHHLGSGSREDVTRTNDDYKAEPLARAPVSPDTEQSERSPSSRSDLELRLDHAAVAAILEKAIWDKRARDSPRITHVYPSTLAAALDLFGLDIHSQDTALEEESKGLHVKKAPLLQRSTSMQFHEVVERLQDLSRSTPSDITRAIQHAQFLLTIANDKLLRTSRDVRHRIRILAIFCFTLQGNISKASRLLLGQCPDLNTEFDGSFEWLDAFTFLLQKSVDEVHSGSATSSHLEVMEALEKLYPKMRALIEIPAHSRLPAPVLDFREAVTYFWANVLHLSGWLDKHLIRLKTRSGNSLAVSNLAEMVVRSLMASSENYGQKLFDVDRILRDHGVLLDDRLQANIWKYLRRRDWADLAYESCMSSTTNESVSDSLIARATTLMADLDKAAEAETLFERLNGANADTNLPEVRSARLSLYCMYDRLNRLQERGEFAALHLPRIEAAYERLLNGEECMDISSDELPVLVKLISGIINNFKLKGNASAIASHLDMYTLLAVRPPLPDIVAAVATCARNNDVASAQIAFDRIAKAGLKPDRLAYAALMTAYARAKDPRSVQVIMERMKGDGIPPNEVIHSILLNAYLESGEWTRAAHLWESLPLQYQRNAALTTTLLKGLVLLATPFSTTSILFNQAFSDRSKTTSRAWSLIMQSACDSGDLVAARKLFDEMTEYRKPTVYQCSILLKAYLNKQDVVNAQKVFSDMQSRGIMPSSVTYGMVVKSVVDGVWPSPTEKASAIVDQLLNANPSAWEGQSTRAHSWMEDVLGPVFTQTVLDRDVRSAVTYFDKLLQAGFSPSITIYTRLMDVYRRNGDLSSVKKTWKRIMAIASRPGIESAKGPVLPNALCIPLSIYMDALSAAYEHTEIARVWQDVASRGFSFDAQNWNHLVVALVRAGEVERAFRVTEEVLIARQEQIQRREKQVTRFSDYSVGFGNIPQKTSPRTKLSTSDPPQRPPNRRHLYRREDYDTALSRMTTNSSPERSDINVMILKRWRPLDIVWRPTYLTIAVLSRVYQQLERDRHVQPARALIGGFREEDAEDDETSDGRPRQGGLTPFALLKRINSRYTKSVRLIMLHRKRRAGKSKETTITKDGPQLLAPKGARGSNRGAMTA